MNPATYFATLGFPSDAAVVLLCREVRLGDSRGLSGRYIALTRRELESDEVYKLRGLRAHAVIVLDPSLPDEILHTVVKPCLAASVNRAKHP